MKKADIEKKIEKFEKLLKKETDPKNKANFQIGIDKYTSMLEDIVEDKPKPTSEPKPKRKPNSRKRNNKPTQPSTRKPATRKPATRKPATEKKPKTGKKRGVQVISSKRVMINGEEVAMNSQEFCDYLLSEFKKRRKKAKDSGTKKKTKSVMAKVSDNIEKGITQAIKQGVKNKKSEIKKDPQAFFSKVKKLETATRGFLNELKNVLGQDFNSKEVTSTIKGIQDLVAELKKKV